MRFLTLVLLVLLISLSAYRVEGGPLPPALSTANISSTPYTPVHEFDPHRDAAADIHAAIAEAQRTHKRIILYLGGDWCPYCAQLSSLFHADPTLLQLRDASFITVYVYYGPGNHNDQALSSYGKFLGIPHYFVLDSDGVLLHSQHLLDLRANGTYSPDKMKQFLSQWAPPAKTPDPASTGN